MKTFGKILTLVGIAVIVFMGGMAFQGFLDRGESTPLAGSPITRAFHYDNTSKTWRFYDSGPDMGRLSTMNTLVSNGAYWIRVGEEGSYQLCGRKHTLKPEWNNIAC